VPPVLARNYSATRSGSPSDHYVYALTDHAEVDRRAALGRLFE
jgi:hypothetical protein